MTQQAGRGNEEIPIDLSRVPTIEAGMAEAKRLDDRFTELARSSLGPPGVSDLPLMLWHLPLFSMINRAVSLHRGIVAMIEQTNPHATFTLMRAYLELVVFAYYVNKHPDYLGSIERPAAELAKGIGRKSQQALLAEAAKQMPGVRHVYATLSEMAHFGSTALWQPFTVSDEPEDARKMRFGTPPHWKRPDEPRIALAMLIENDEAALWILADFAHNHVVPSVLAVLEHGAQEDGEDEVGGAPGPLFGSGDMHRDRRDGQRGR